MAKGIAKTNAAVSKNSGRVGNVRYYQKGGNTYIPSPQDAANNYFRVSLDSL